MAVKLNEKNDGLLVDIGEHVRIERRGLAEQEPMLDANGKQAVHPVTGEKMTRTKIGKDGQPHYVWVIYDRVHTGVEYHLPEGGKGKVTADHLRNNDGVVPREHVKKMGSHPVIKDKAGEQIETTEEYIWVPVGEATSKEDALAKARKLAGE